MIRLTTLLLTIVLAGCAPTNVNKLIAKKGGERLTPDRVLSLVEGNTLQMYGYNSESFLYLDPSSKVFALDDSNSKDTGRWDVSDQGELCLRMTSWWYGDLKCYLMYQVNDEYKLTDNNGLIKFSVTTYPGDYKNSYYVDKTHKRSYRKSIRSTKSAVEPVTDLAAETPTAPTPKQPEKIISEENTFSSSQDTRNLRTTVKWMARNCPGCNLAETDLRKADLVGARLAGANLHAANLRMANLRRADLQGANLEDAVLAYCNMPGADLRGANLRDANLKGANLIRADLTGAELTGANFEGALTEGTKGLKR
jgi:hypothetical protein